MVRFFVGFTSTFPAFPAVWNSSASWSVNCSDSLCSSPVFGAFACASAMFYPFVIAVFSFKRRAESYKKTVK